jgi:hypothetical protein
MLMPSHRAALLAASAAAITLAGAADAAAAMLSAAAAPGNPRQTVASYVAAAGEANRVVVTRLDDYAVQVSDPGAVIAPGENCIAVDPHTARCSIPAAGPGRPPFMQLARVELGDGGDSAEVLPDSKPVALDADGGAGDDRLTGALLADHLNGGGGRDELQGNGGDDALDDGDTTTTADGDVMSGGDGTDSVSYAARTAAVVVDLADPAPDGQRGEADILSSIESVTGGSADDWLEGRGSYNIIEGGAGDDHLEGHGATDNLYGGPGRDVLLGQDGNDYLDGGRGNDDVSGGDRKDSIVLAGGGADEVDCGGDRDTVHRAHADDLVHADCQAVDFRYAATPLSPWGAQAYPTVTGHGRRLVFGIDCPRPSSVDGGTLQVRERGGRGRLLAAGAIAGTAERHCRSANWKPVAVRASLTALGRTLASRDSGITSTVRLRGRGVPPVAWSIQLHTG